MSSSRCPWFSLLCGLSLWSVGMPAGAQADGEPAAPMAPAASAPAPSSEPAKAPDAQPHDDGPDTPWRGRMTASLSATSGNTRSHNALVDIDVSRRRMGGKATVTAYANEGKSGSGQDRETTAGKWGGTGQYDLDLDPIRFVFGRVGLEHDRVIDLALRDQIAAGLGVHILNEDKRTFDVFAGVGRTVARYSTAKLIAGERASRFSNTGFLLGNEYSEQFTPTVSFKQRLEAFLSVDGNTGHLYKGSMALNVDMTKTLALTVGVTANHNSRVAAGQKKNDLSLNTGLSVKVGP